MKQYPIINSDDLKEYLKKYNRKLIKINDGAKQLRNCQAWEINVEILNNSTGELKTYKALQSYYTIVALWNGVLHTWRKYSPTTSRQITWWSRAL